MFFTSIIIPNQIERNIAKDNIIMNIRNLFKKEKKDKGIKDKVLRDIRTLFESDEDEYYRPTRTGNAFSGSYVEYESNGDKDKTLLIKEYLHKIRPYLSDIIQDHKTQGVWKTQLTIALNFICSKDSNET